MFDIDRKTASKLLKMSIRTVDRYITKNKLSIKERDGRIWLNKKEILKFRAQKRVDSTVDISTPRMSIDKIDVIPVDMSIDTDDTVYRHSSRKHATVSQNTEETVYRKLFEELQDDLRQKQERLEGANYRVGQLEACLKDSIPLLDYNRDLNREKTEKERLVKTLDARQFEAEQLLNSLKEERFNKKIFLIILFILLLLQPLWLIFPLK